MKASAWVDWQIGDPAENWRSLALNHSKQTFSPNARYYMHAAFSAMPQRDKMAYGELLRTIEGWAEGSRHALNSDSVEGGFIDG